LSQKYSYQKLLKSHNSSSTYIIESVRDVFLRHSAFARKHRQWTGAHMSTETHRHENNYTQSHVTTSIRTTSRD